jgi:tartronate-semialdehyde synthase
VGAQFHLPYIHVVVNNSYLGLIRSRSAGSRWTTACSWRSTTSTARASGYGVDHVKVAEGLGCKAVRVERPEDIASAFERPRS